MAVGSRGRVTEKKKCAKMKRCVDRACVSSLDCSFVLAPNAWRATGVHACMHEIMIGSDGTILAVGHAWMIKDGVGCRPSLENPTKRWWLRVRTSSCTAQKKNQYFSPDNLLHTSRRQLRTRVTQSAPRTALCKRWRWARRWAVAR
jgi:hypothetical protein